MNAKLKNLWNYIQGVESGQRKINHICCHHVGKELRKYCMWFDTNEWQNAPKWEKVLHVVIFHAIVLLWVFLLIRLVGDFDVLPISRIAEGFSLSLGGFLLYLSFVLFNLKRDLITKAIADIDSKFRSVEASPVLMDKWWKSARKIHVLEIKVLTGCVVVGLLIGIPPIVYTLCRGQLLYETIIPLSDKSYTFTWWLQYIYQATSLLYSGIFFSLKEFINMSLFYQLSFLMRLQSDKILELCQDPNFDPDVELKKLVDIIREMAELTEIGDKLKELTSAYILIFHSVAYIITSFTGLCIIIESKNGWLNAIAKSITYFCYALIIVFCWATLGEYFTDSVNLVDSALYECNWVHAPPRIKKLLLLYKIRLTKPNYIRGGPFIVCTQELFTDILKKTYYLLAILMDLLK